MAFKKWERVAGRVLLRFEEIVHKFTDLEDHVLNKFNAYGEQYSKLEEAIAQGLELPENSKSSLKALGLTI